MDITLSSFLGYLEDKIITFYNEVDIKISRSAQETTSRLRIAFDIMTSDPKDCISHEHDTIYIDHVYNAGTSYGRTYLNPSEQRALLKDIIETIHTEHEDIIKRASVANVLDETNNLCNNRGGVASINTPLIKAMTMPIEDFVIALERQSLQYNDTRLNINDVTLKPQKNDVTGLDDYLFTATVSNMTSRLNVSFVGIDGVDISPYDPCQHINKHQQFKILSHFVEALDQTMGVANINQTIDTMIDDVTDELFKIE